MKTVARVRCDLLLSLIYCGIKLRPCALNRDPQGQENSTPMPLRCFAGHTLAVQKKTLNRLKMSQIQRLTTGVNAESETSHNDDKQMPNEQPTPVLARSSGSTSDAEVSEVNYCLFNRFGYIMSRHYTAQYHDK